MSSSLKGSVDLVHRIIAVVHKALKHLMDYIGFRMKKHARFFFHQVKQMAEEREEYIS
jgi:hypothetical protein